MSVVEVPPHVAKPISSVAIIINFIILLSIGLYHIITTKKNHQYGLNIQKSPLSLNLTFILLTIAICLLITLANQLTNPFNTLSSCKFAIISGTTLYAIFKLTLYLTLISRVYGAFKDSPLEYSAFKLKILASILILWQFLNIVIIGVTYEFNLDADSFPKCVPVAPAYIYASGLLLDLVSAVINLYLFIKPVLKLRSIISAESKDEIMKLLAIKQCILCIIAVSTTFIALICIALMRLVQLYLAADVNISTLSVILS